jgi:ComF family protein
VYTGTSGFYMGTLDLIFPKKCVGCGQSGAYFCPQCLNFVSLKPERICPACLKPSIGGFTHPRCQTPYNLDGLTSIFAYKGVIKKAIQKLKYKFISDLAQDLIELFLSSCGEDKAFRNLCRQGEVILIPVPLHPSRKRWRGFNQAELLGKMIASSLDLKFLPDVLKRVKKTKPQVGLDKEERKKNIKEAFKINRDYESSIISNSSLILFDDVWTSGETLKESTKVLKRNRAEKVWGLTMAR